MRKITEMKAAGQLVMIELLSADEIMGSGLLKLSDNTKVEAPQAYILDIGPGLDKKQWGFEVGDRIIFSGSMVPLPKREGQRQKGIIDAYAVKALLREESPIATN